MTTDPDSSGRLVALRSTRPSQPFPHAQATKIATAGVSLSAVFGIVAYLGHSAEAQAAADARHLQRIAASQTAAATLYRPPPTVPPTVPPTAPSISVAGGPVQPVVVTAPPPQVINVPVAAPAPRPASGQGGQRAGTPAPSNTTKTSG